VAGPNEQHKSQTFLEAKGPLAS